MLLFALLLAVALGMAGWGPLSNVDLRCQILCTVRTLVILNRVLALVPILFLLVAYWAALAYVFPNASVFSQPG